MWFEVHIEHPGPETTQVIMIPCLHYPAPAYPSTLIMIKGALWEKLSLSQKRPLLKGIRTDIPHIRRLLCLFGDSPISPTPNDVYPNYSSLNLGIILDFFAGRLF